jgi:predicted phage tail component-like protein
MMQDYIGFTYNGKHSIKDLKIYRTSSGRYDDNITATMTDKTVDVPGGDGQYYFGTTFKNRTFTVAYAFENLKEADIAEIKRVFSGDGIHELVFDERPYKVWSAKVTGTASMKHLCFEENGERIYKGEGSITFTCYYPFARTPNKLWRYKTAEEVKKMGGSDKDIIYGEADGKFLENYNDKIYTNKNEWATASGLHPPYEPMKGIIKGDRQISCIGTLTVTQLTEQD